MANKKSSFEDQVQNWRELSLILLLLMGVVGAFSYTLIFRQRDQIELQEMRINYLQEKVEDLGEQVESLPVK